MPDTVILSGIVGSTAYGLDREGSDVDYLGCYVVPTERFLGLAPPTDANSSLVSNDPDRQMHEVGKFCRLLLQCNPTITETLYLGQYEVLTQDGQELVRMRREFLSAPRVRDRYMGYANAQFRKLEERGDGSFSSDTRRRTAKHGRHLLRLLKQGHDLYSTGHLSVKLDDPERYHAFGDAVAQDASVGAKALREYRDKFDATTSPLPDAPNTELVNDWLVSLRIACLP